MSPSVPTAILSSGTKIVTFVTRTAKTNSTFLPTFIDKLVKGGAVLTANTVEGFRTWLSSGNLLQKGGNILLTLSTLASLGFAVNELIEDKDDPAAAALKDQLTLTAARAREMLSHKANELLEKVGNTSVHMPKDSEPNDEDRAVREARKRTLVWALQFFGSDVQVVRAHIYLQALLEMDINSLIDDLNEKNLRGVQVATEAEMLLNSQLARRRGREMAAGNLLLQNQQAARFIPE